MDNVEYHKRIKETVLKFKDGEKRFQTSALFNKVVQMLVRDVEPIDIIDQLINTTDDTTKAMEYHLRMGSGISILNKY